MLPFSTNEIDDNIIEQIEEDDDILSLENNIIFSNFKNLTPQDRYLFIENKLKSKGLDSNEFLVNYFVSAILKNVVDDSPLNVDNYLNIDLNKLLKDNRMAKLNSHAFMRTRPFLINNPTHSAFPNIVPYKTIEYLEDK
jgi:hypothetical protein